MPHICLLVMRIYVCAPPLFRGGENLRMVVDACVFYLCRCDSVAIQRFRYEIDVMSLRFRFYVRCGFAVTSELFRFASSSDLCDCVPLLRFRCDPVGSL